LASAPGGAITGTSGLAISRPDGLDLCFVVNTRNFGGAKAMGEASNGINRALDVARDSMTTNQLRY
jgi:hypothetical protein